MSWFNKKSKIPLSEIQMIDGGTWQAAHRGNDAQKEFNFEYVRAHKQSSGLWKITHVSGATRRAEETTVLAEKLEVNDAIYRLQMASDKLQRRAKSARVGEFSFLKSPEAPSVMEVLKRQRNGERFHKPQIAGHPALAC